MNPKDLTLEQWQKMIYEYRVDHDPTSTPAAIRCDGTQFSVGAMYGGFTCYGESYTCFYFDGGAVIGVRMDFLKWVTKKLKEAK